MENSERQPPGAEESEPFNGIKGLEKLDETPVSAKERVEKPVGVLSRKARRSIEAKISRRQKAIEKIFDELESAKTPEEIKTLISEEGMLEKMSRLSTEQAQTAETESMGHIEHEQFENNVIKIAGFGKDVLAKIQGGESFVPADLVKAFRKEIIPPQPELEVSASETVGTHNAKKSASASASESAAGASAGTVTETGAVKTESEKASAGDKKSEEGFSLYFDKAQTFDDLYAMLQGIEIEVLEGRKRKWYLGKGIIEIIKKRVAEFEKMAQTEKIEKRILDFISVFGSSEIQDALRRAFIHKSLLKPEQVITSNSETASSPANRTEATPPDSTVDSIKILKEFDGILERVAETEFFERSLNKKSKPFRISGKEFAEYLRNGLSNFTSKEFIAFSPEKRNERIARFVDTVVIQPELQADLRVAFQRAGLFTGLESVTDKEATKKEIPKRGSAVSNLGIFRRSAVRTALEEGGEDFMSVKRRIASAKQARGMPAPPLVSAAGIYAPTPAPVAQPQASVESRQGQPAQSENITVPAVRKGTEVAVPERPPLHERTESGAATLDNPAFNEFLNAVEKQGFIVALGTRRAETYTQAFEQRGAVARGIVELYRNQLTQDLGAPSGIEDIGRIISAYIEKLSVESPERVLAYNTLLTRANECSSEIAALEERKNRVVSGEETTVVLAGVDERKKIFELAKASNRFWTGMGRFTGIGALFARSEKLKAQKEAREKVREQGYGTWLGGVSAASEPFGKFLKREGKIDNELAKIKTQIEAASSRSTIEAALRAAQNRLAELKKELIIQNAAHNEAAEIIRQGLADGLQRYTNPDATGIEGFEAAEATLENLANLAKKKEAAVGFMDYPRHLSYEQLKQAFRANAERRAREEMRRALFETLANLGAPGRFSAILAQFEKWKLVKKVGRHEKSAQEGVRQFAADVLSEYVDELQAVLREKKEKRNLAGENAAETRRLDAEEGELSTRIRLANALRDEIVPPPEPVRHTPHVGSSEISPIISKESPMAGGGLTQRRIVINEIPSTEEEVPVKTAETPTGDAESAPHDEEKISVATFHDVMNLPYVDLSRVLKLTTMDKVSAALSFATTADVEKVRSRLASDDIIRFDRLQGFNILNSEALVEQAQKEIIELARKALVEQSTLSVSEKDQPGATDVPSIEKSAPAVRGMGSEKEKRIVKQQESKIEQISIPEAIGQAFIKFLHEGSSFDDPTLLEKLQEVLPNAEVRSVFRPTGAQLLYFLNEREGSALKCYLVTVGSEHYLLPCPANDQKFETILGFNKGQGFDFAPKSLMHFTPAKVFQNGLHWEIETPGWLHKPLEEKTP